MLYERVGNLHVHTTRSDGTAEPEEIAEIAQRLGLDFVIINDHNYYGGECEGWYGRTLLLVGEEIHDPARPEVNHLLVLGAGQDLSRLGGRTQALIDAARECGGLCFLAHPFEHAEAFTGQPEINWVSWSVQGYAGLEVWNYMSEFKAHVTSLPVALLYSFLPKLAIQGPFPETLAKWDHLANGAHIVAVGGSDAHGTLYRLGPLKRRIFCYEHLFGALNTHVLVPRQWSGDLGRDGDLVYDALGHGRSFIAYDGLAPARGFVFEAQHQDSAYTMGDEVLATGPVRFHARTPLPARLRLVHNGFCVAEEVGTELLHESWSPGTYRVEAYRTYCLKKRGWIFSNPIFVRTERGAEANRGGEL